MKKLMPVIFSTIFISIILIATTGKYGKSTSQMVVINEVCSRNATISLAEDYLGDDYIELYNTTNQPINLAGWWLSDDRDNLQKYCLPEIILEPSSYILLYANGNIGEYSLNFKISWEGEELFLISPDGQKIDEIYIPKLQMDTAYARKKDAGKVWDVMEPSPGCNNGGALSVKKQSLSVPSFSYESGFYKDEFTLKLSAKRGHKIYYTLDGSVPTEDSFLYEKGIEITNNSSKENVLNAVKTVVLDWEDYAPIEENVDKATVVRAIAVDRKGNASEVATETFFVGMDQYSTNNVLSIVADPDLLIGQNGIFVTGTEYDQWYVGSEMSSDNNYEEYRTENYKISNFFKRGRTYEVVSEIQFFEAGEKTLEQLAGVRVQGNATRVSPKKNLQLISRSVYSENSLFDKQIFENKNLHAFYVSPIQEKAYFMKLAENRDIGIQSAKECVVFINGEYWYTGVIMEKYDETYFREHYGVTEDNVLMIKDTEAAVGSKYEYIYTQMIEYLRDDSVSQEEKGVYLYDHVDLQSFIDWLCINLYLGNDDVSYKKNSILWRTIKPENGVYGDCKWRWNLYDIDHATIGAVPESVDFSEFSIISDNRFYWGLRTVPDFQQKFVLTAMDMINTNFSLENVEKVLAEWKLDISHSDNYFVKRPEYMIQSMRNEFDLTGTVESIILDCNNAEGGLLYINTVNADVSDGAWEGKYFTDYPVKITAVANPGYVFKGWVGNLESEEDSVKMYLSEGENRITAIFEKE